ncbi:MAG: hypothetical protein D6734_08540 [Candidatus Schekmanbacteria bacterium]|nr:MAG: hypothetical protein D6734_08540 [Candidatus Schekmanbacteria bacterium]
MNCRRAGSLIFFQIMLFFILSLFPIQDVGSAIKVNRRDFTSSNVCKKCHTDIYKNWKASMHSASISDPIFEVSFMEAIKDKGNEARKFCLQCHSPTTRVTEDYELKADISSEGITCSFCHSIDSIDMNQNIPVIINKPGDTMRGPFANITSPAHKIKESKVHRTAKICGACHEMKGKNGVTILGTYSEWSESSYSKEGIKCQNCHMPEMFGIYDVNQDVKKTNNFARDHSVFGGHSQIKLNKAATLSSKVEDLGDKIVVNTTVLNRESGHKIPTGIPTRKIILEVNLLNEKDDVIASQSRIYQKVLADETGKILDNIKDIFFYATRVVSDNRIAPKEARKETFEFKKPKGLKKYKIENVLKYQMQTPVISLKTMEVEMARNLHNSAEIKTSSEDVPIIVIFIIAFTAGILITYLILRASKKSGSS